jgi:hypothetical protein
MGSIFVGSMSFSFTSGDFILRQKFGQVPHMRAVALTDRIEKLTQFDVRPHLNPSWVQVPIK